MNRCSTTISQLEKECSSLDDVKVENFIIHKKSIKDVKNQIESFNGTFAKEQEEKEIQQKIEEISKSPG